jgi:hypothetical protein
VERGFHPPRLRGDATLVVAVEFDRLLETAERPVAVAFARQYRSAVEIDICVLRIELERDVEVGEGLVDLAFARVVSPSDTPRAHRDAAAIVGIEADRAIEIGQGGRLLAFDEVAKGSPLIGNGALRVELYSFSVIRSGFLASTRTSINVCPVYIRPCCIRGEVNRVG